MTGHLVLTRQPGQSWRDAAIAQGALYGLSAEVTAMFDDMKANGLSDERAALDACIEWDVLPFVEEGT